MTSIITTSLKEITLSSQFLTLQSPNGEIEVNIKKMMKEPIHSENCYFNATHIAKHFDKDIQSYMRSGGKEYIEIVDREFKTVFLTDLKLKTHYAKRGKYHSGTWLHREIFLDFCRWLDKSFARKMDLVIKELIIHSNELKIERENTKFHFKGLTDVIKDIYIPAQESDNGKKFAYSTLANLINMVSIGTTAKKYRLDNNLDETPIRDQVDKATVLRIDKAEENLNGYIKFAGITDYDTLKDRLNG